MKEIICISSKACYYIKSINKKKVIIADDILVPLNKKVRPEMGRASH